MYVMSKMVERKVYCVYSVLYQTNPSLSR